MASIITISVHFLLFAVLIGEIHGDWLKEYYAKNRNAAKLLEATTEPLNNVLPYEQVQYSIANISYDYRSSTKFHPRGMAHLYVLTEKFINFIGKDQAFPDGKQSRNLIYTLGITMIIKVTSVFDSDYVISNN